jgi:CBS domain-containing protein
MNQMYTARDVMSTWVFTLAPDADVYRAIDTLVAKRAPGAPVVDEFNRLVGILTEKDCLRVLTGSAYGNLSGGHVRDYMSPIGVTVSPNMDLFSVAQLFLSSNFPSLPVLDGGKLVGTISRQDMLLGIQGLQRAVEAERLREDRHLKAMQDPRTISEMQRLVASQKRAQLAAVLTHRHAPDEASGR